MMRPAIKDARVIPAGVDLTTFTPSSNRVQIRRELGFSATDRVLLFVANLGGKNPYKDFPTLQAAIRILAASLPGEPIKLVVIGQEGPTEEFGSARIEHRAYCSDPRDLAKYYQSADLYVHAAIEEVFGIVLVEAMASGLPAVASRVGGIPEVISHGREGLLVPPRNAVALENAIRTLLSQPTRLAAMGRAARATAEIRYERTLMMDRYRNLFEEILAGQGRASVTSSVQPEDTRLVQIDSDFVAPRNVR
jgi:glycosyltransferase involved in cell wall biosynthesis